MLEHEQNTLFICISDSFLSCCAFCHNENSKCRSSNTDVLLLFVFESVLYTCNGEFCAVGNTHSQHLAHCYIYIYIYGKNRTGIKTSNPAHGSNTRNLNTNPHRSAESMFHFKKQTHGSIIFYIYILFCSVRTKSCSS